jgi:hypothetical protein
VVVRQKDVGLRPGGTVLLRHAIFSFPSPVHFNETSRRGNPPSAGYGVASGGGQSIGKG